MTTDSIISSVWSFCHTLHDDGVRYGDRLEQLTYLIFLKMADEYSKPPHSRKVGVPARFAWPAMRPLKGAGFEVHKRMETRHTEKNLADRWRKFTHAKLAALDKTSLDLLWLKDDSLADLAEEITENIEAGLANSRELAAALGK